MLSTARYFIFCWSVALATHFSGLYQPMHTDWSTRLRVARDWRGGAALYRETYCNTQPVVYLWILLIDSSRPELSVYVAESTLAALSATVFCVALRRELPRAASVAPLLLIAWSGTSTTFYGGQITEAPALWCDVLALSCFALAARHGRVWLAALAGGLFCLTVGFRIPAVLNCVAWLPLLAQSARRQGFGRAIGLLLTAMLAAGGVLFALYVHGRWDGYWADFVTVLERNLRYGAIDRLPPSASLFEALRTMARILIQNSAAPVLATASLALLLSRARSLRRRQRTWLTVGLLWLSAALASAFPGGRHYDHYYHVCWAPISLISVMWLDNIGVLTRGAADRRLPRVSFLSWGLTAGVIGVAVLFNTYGAAKAYRDLRAGTHRWSAIADASDYLNRTTPRDVPVLMNLWGDWAELYWRAPRPAPSLPIPHVVPQDRYGEWVSETVASPPKLIVTDGTPWRPIDGPADPKDLERLQRLLDRKYKQVERIGELMFLAREPAQ
jgi:hypothetical protein